MKEIISHHSDVVKVKSSSVSCFFTPINQCFPTADSLIARYSMHTSLRRAFNLIVGNRD